jgi:hypothetical protein
MGLKLNIDNTIVEIDDDNNVNCYNSSLKKAIESIIENYEPPTSLPNYYLGLYNKIFQFYKKTKLLKLDELAAPLDVVF